MSERSDYKKQFKCVVPDCDDTTSKRHRFPKNNIDLYNLWLKQVNVPLLNSLSREQVYEKYRVCDRHFHPNFIVSGSQRGLIKLAYPTEFLPDSDPSSDTRSDEDEIEIPSKMARLAQDFGASTSKASETTASMDISYHQFHDHCYASHETPSTHGTHLEINDALPNPSEITMSPQKSPSRSSPSVLALHRGIRKRKLILQDLSVTRQADLTPKCKKLYKKVVDWSKKTRKLQSKVANFRERCAKAEQVAKSGNFHHLIDHVNTVTYNFILQQIRTQKLPPKGRRFTLNDKLLSLSIFKASGRGYRMLSKIFALPSKRTLTNLLNKLPFRPGINEKVFNSLKAAVDTMEAADKFCAILFDEIYIDCTLFYDKKEDYIQGIEDFGDQRNPKLADHANVFMVKGVRRQWKQPIAFTFSSGPMKSESLKQMIHKIIGSCQNIGLTVCATVCDQGSANQAALNKLIQENQVTGESGTFLVNETEIVPLYDVPHLFKGIRNNLLTKDLHFTIEGVDRVAKWDHIVQFYHLDTSDDTRLCVKLTDMHVLPAKINKMKVSCCTQVFSHRVGSLMKRISQWDIKDEHALEAGAIDTGTLILFLDELFDSLNSNNKIAPRSKPMKGGVTQNSGHVQFWYNSIKVLRSMKFYCPKKKKFVTNPSVNNLIKTLHGFIYLSQKLLDGPFSYVLTRSFNQDPLENFFASIRSHGKRNTSPNVSQFVASFKSLLVTNFMSSHSPLSNCEHDFSAGALDTLQCLITGDVIGGITELQEDDLNISVPEFISLQRRTRVANTTLTYVAGYVAKKALKASQNCASCKTLLQYSGDLPEIDMDMIDACQYKSSHLIKPGKFLTFIVKESISKLFYIIPRICNVMLIKKKLNNLLLNDLNFNPLKCGEHSNLHLLVCSNITSCILYYWTKRVNLIIKGKDSKFINFMNKHPNFKAKDPIKTMAYKKYQQRAVRKSKK